MRDDGRTLLTGSAGLVENQIKNWVRQRVCAVDKAHGRCKKVVLKHLNVERKPIADVHVVTINSDPATDGTEVADKVVLEIAESSLRDANDVKAGVQTYAIYAYYTNDPNFCPRKIFRVSADEDFDPESGGVSEPPTEKGILSQLMRHNEINSKNSLVAMGYIIQTFQKEIDQQRQMNQKFLEQQIDTSMFIQEVMNDAHKRRQEERESELKMSMMEGAFEHIKVLMPIIANKLAGRQIVPENMPPEFGLLASLLENLSDQRQTVLRDMLNPSQLTTLAELLGAYEKSKAKIFGDRAVASEDDENEETTKSIAKRPANRLLQLFEKRSTLVNKDNRFTSKDVFMRKMEEKAERIKSKIGDATRALVDDPKKS